MNFTTTTTNIILAGCMFFTLPTASAAPSKSNVKVSADVTVSGQIFIVTKGRDNIKLALVNVAAISEKEMLEHIKRKHDYGIEQQNQLTPKLEAAMREVDAAKADVKSARDISSADINKRLKTVMAHIEKKGKYDPIYQALLDKVDSANKSAEEKASALHKLKSEYAMFNSIEFYTQDMPTPVSVSKTDADGKFELTVPSGKYVIVAITKRAVFRYDEQYYWLVRIDASSPVKSLMLSNDNQVETKCEECVLLP